MFFYFKTDVEARSSLQISKPDIMIRLNKIIGLKYFVSKLISSWIEGGSLHSTANAQKK